MTIYIYISVLTHTFSLFFKTHTIHSLLFLVVWPLGNHTKTLSEIKCVIFAKARNLNTHTYTHRETSVSPGVKMLLESGRIFHSGSFSLFSSLEVSLRCSRFAPTWSWDFEGFDFLDRGWSGSLMEVMAPNIPAHRLLANLNWKYKYYLFFYYFSCCDLLTHTSSLPLSVCQRKQ